MAPILSKTSSTLAVVTQEIELLEEMMLDMQLSARQETMSAIEAVDAANQQEIEALKAQVAMMEKTVEIAQTVLIQTQSRCVEKTRLLGANRVSRAQSYAATQKEIGQEIKRFEQLDSILHKMNKERESELLTIYYANNFWTYLRMNWVIMSESDVSRYRKEYMIGRQFIQTYGSAHLKHRYNEDLANSMRLTHYKPPAFFSVPVFPGF